MMIVALLMRPWIFKMKEQKVEPKVLADDVCIIAKGKAMVARLAKALEMTHEYCHDFGGTIALTKSFNFASTAKARAWLQRTMWRTIGTSIPVVTDFRYLGAHFCTTGRRANGTGDER